MKFDPGPIARQKKRMYPDNFIMKLLTIVLGPPAKVAPTDDIIKDKADQHPGHIVERSRGRHVARAGKD